VVQGEVPSLAGSQIRQILTKFDGKFDEMRWNWAGSNSKIGKF
jgi:hypothetical protein